MNRQLAAILSADVAGYSRLTGQDEESTHLQLSSGLNLLTDKIHAFRGKKLHEAGDAVLAEFSSSSDAVEAAIEFQRSMFRRKLDSSMDFVVEFRIGINVGEVIHDRDDICGDGVNIVTKLYPMTAVLDSNRHYRQQNWLFTALSVFPALSRYLGPRNPLFSPALSQPSGARIDFRAILKWITGQARNDG